MLFNVELRRQCQPLAYRQMPASNGAPPSLQHERSNVEELQNTRFQEYLYRMQTHQGLEYMVVVENVLG